MATQTTNLGLTLPIGTENVSRQVINDNMTAIDTAIGAVPEGSSLFEEVESKVPATQIGTDAEFDAMIADYYGQGG